MTSLTKYKGSRWPSNEKFNLMEMFGWRPNDFGWMSTFFEEPVATLKPSSFKVDVTETDTGYDLKAELPGVKREDIQVDIDSNLVTITAEVKRESEEKDSRLIRVERDYGSISRSFRLSKTINKDDCEAIYRDGILTLKLVAAAPKDTSKRLEVKE